MFSLKFKINIYYIKYENNEMNYFYSKKISEILKIDPDFYVDKIKEFGGLQSDEIMYFLEEENGLKALEWIESVYILTLLGGN